MSFCTNCGQQLVDGAKFCHGCGFSVSITPSPVTLDSPIETTANPQERKQEFVGKVLKCTHCGNPITERDVVCPACGMEITGRTAVLSVKAFHEQLMEIESHRKHAPEDKFSVFFSSLAADPVDKQKLSLIRNFPIPNTIDDILEFVMLAIANINVNISKKSWVNNSYSTEQYAMEMPKVISNAWVLKLQQAYQKAEVMFPDAPVFQKIQKLYFDKMKELKIKM